MTKFKVGDRVAIYCDSGRATGTVTGAGPDDCDGYNIVKVKNDFYNDEFIYHPKQLRKLKPKPKQPEAPEEVWVNWYHGYEGCDAPEKTRKDADRNADLTRIACVKYRRVSEDGE